MTEPKLSDFVSIKIVNFANQDSNNKFGIKEAEMENMISTLERADETPSEWLNTNVGKLADTKLYAQGGYNRSSAASNYPIYYQKTKNNPNRTTWYFPYDTFYGIRGGSGGRSGTWGQQVYYAVIISEINTSEYDAAMREWEKLDAKQKLKDRDEKLAAQKEEQKRKLEEERQLLAEERERRQIEKERINQQKEFDNEDKLEQLEIFKEKYGDYPMPTAEIAIEKPTGLLDILLNRGQLKVTVYTTQQESMNSSSHPGVAYAGPNIWENAFPNTPYPNDGPIVILWRGKLTPVTQANLSQFTSYVPGVAGAYTSAKAAISRIKEDNYNKFKPRRRY